MSETKPEISRGLSNQLIAAIAGLVLIAILIAALILDRHSATNAVAPGNAALPCSSSSLQLGTSKFRIQPLNIGADRSPSVPSDKPGIAYWINNTTAHYVFGLSPTAANTSLREHLEAGDSIQITWADCSSEEFAVALVAQDIPETSALLDQSQGGITVFVPNGSNSTGWSIEGKRPEMLTSQAPEPADATAVQAEVSFLEQSISADGKSLLLKIEIKNTGQKPIHLTEPDISLAAGEGAPVRADKLEPSLPVDIQPGQSQTIMLTFPKPAGNVATFRLLDFSVDLYF